MGAFSTIQVTRTAARKYLLGIIMESSDSELEELLDSFLCASLYTAMVVPDDTVTNDDEHLG